MPQVDAVCNLNKCPRVWYILNMHTIIWITSSYLLFTLVHHLLPCVPFACSSFQRPQATAPESARGLAKNKLSRCVLRTGDSCASADSRISWCGNEDDLGEPSELLLSWCAAHASRSTSLRPTQTTPCWPSRTFTTFNTKRHKLSFVTIHIKYRIFTTTSVPFNSREPLIAFVVCTALPQSLCRSTSVHRSFWCR